MDNIKNIASNVIHTCSVWLVSTYEFLKPYYLQYGTYVKIAIIALLCLLFFIVMYGYGFAAMKRQYMTTLEKIKFKSNKFIHSAKSGSLNYDTIATKLSKTGADFYSKGKLTPLTFVAMKVLFMLLGLVIGTIFLNILGGLVLAVIMYSLPDIYIKGKNNADNQNMQEDIMRMNDIIILQAGAGTYITQILIDAYLSVKNKRLKAALLELTGNIKNSGNVKESLETFQTRFDNEDLLDISIALSQGAETGDSVQMLEDIKKHATVMQKNYEKATEQKMKSRNFILGLLVFIGAMAIIGYGLLSGLSENIAFLNMGA